MTEFLNSIGIAEPFGKGFSVVLTFLVAWLITQRFIPKVREFAIKVGWADMPNERRLNKEPLPNAGGLAIFGGFIASVVVAWALRPILIEQVQIQVLAILLGGALLVLVGFIDDQFSLPPMFRIVVQVIASLLLVVNGLKIDLGIYSLFSGWGDALPVLNTLFTIVWVVGITNAINLIDGVDGVAGGIGFIAAMVLLVTAAQFPDRAAAVVLLAGLAGAVLGYLRYNFNPSQIIMGDTGSYLIGYTLASVSLLGTLKLAAGASVIVPVIILALPIFDTTQVIIRRLRKGLNPFSNPDKTHIHHQILHRTGNARKTAIAIWAITLGLSVVGMGLQGVKPVVIVVAVVVIAGFLTWIAYRRVRALQKDNERNLN